MTQPVNPVRSIAKMDNETLIKHMNARHQIDPSRPAYVGIEKSDPDESLLRREHDHHHRTKAMNHTHTG